MSSEEETPESSNSSGGIRPPSSSRETRDEILNYLNGVTEFLGFTNSVANVVSDGMRQAAQEPTDLNVYLRRVHQEPGSSIPRLLLGGVDSMIQAVQGIGNSVNQMPRQAVENSVQEVIKVGFSLLFKKLDEKSDKCSSRSESERKPFESSSQVMRITEVSNDDDEDDSNSLKSELSSTTAERDSIPSIHSILTFEGITLHGGDVIIQEKELLGEGSFGKVFRGEFNGKPAAIKTMTSISTTYTESFLKEMNMLKSKCRHEHILELWAVFDRDYKDAFTYPRVVMEYCGKGDLKSYFKKIKNYEDDCQILGRNPYKRTPCSSGPSGGLVVKMSELFQWSTMLTLGMEFLAEKEIVHGDLALRNLLLTDDNVLKIGDFGLSRELKGKGYYRIQPQNGVLPTTHTAPEVFRDLKLTIASEVWAYGITLWEMFSLGKDVGQDITFKEFERAGRTGAPLLKPQYAGDEIYDIMKTCWALTAEDRPTFTEVVCRLVELQTN